MSPARFIRAELIPQLPEWPKHESKHVPKSKPEPSAKTAEPKKPNKPKTPKKPGILSIADMIQSTQKAQKAEQKRTAAAAKAKLKAEKEKALKEKDTGDVSETGDVGPETSVEKSEVEETKSDPDQSNDLMETSKEDVGTKSKKPTKKKKKNDEQKTTEKKTTEKKKNQKKKAQNKKKAKIPYEKDETEKAPVVFSFPILGQKVEESTGEAEHLKTEEPPNDVEISKNEEPTDEVELPKKKQTKQKSKQKSKNKSSDKNEGSSVQEEEPVRENKKTRKMTERERFEMRQNRLDEEVVLDGFIEVSGEELQERNKVRRALAEAEFAEMLEKSDLARERRRKARQIKGEALRLFRMEAKEEKIRLKEAEAKEAHLKEAQESSPFNVKLRSIKSTHSNKKYTERLPKIEPIETIMGLTDEQVHRLSPNDIMLKQVILQAEKPLTTILKFVQGEKYQALDPIDKEIFRIFSISIALHESKGFKKTINIFPEFKEVLDNFEELKLSYTQTALTRSYHDMHDNDFDYTLIGYIGNIAIWYGFVQGIDYASSMEVRQRLGGYHLWDQLFKEETINMKRWKHSIKFRETFPFQVNQFSVVMRFLNLGIEE